MALFPLPARLWGEVGGERHVRVWIAADVLLGVGTALMYPALQAGAADEANPSCRGLALGLYRFIRDMGYVFGALACGHLTDSIGYENTFYVNATLLGALAILFLVLYRQAVPTGPVLRYIYWRGSSSL